MAGEIADTGARKSLRCIRVMPRRGVIFVVVSVTSLVGLVLWWSPGTVDPLPDGDAQETFTGLTDASRVVGG